MTPSYTFIAAILISHSFNAFAAPPIELFGAKLKGSTRAALRAALEKSPLVATRRDDGYFADLYDPSSALDGATELAVTYVYKTGKFASAKYTFESFIAPAQVTAIASLVVAKYGRPSVSSGNPSLGPVEYIWKRPDDLTISVSRGWPDTTTYLTYTDETEIRNVRAEIEKNRQLKLLEDQKRQSKAF
jgi:hypothetical protein